MELNKNPDKEIAIAEAREGLSRLDSKIAQLAERFIGRLNEGYFDRKREDDDEDLRRLRIVLSDANLDRLRRKIDLRKNLRHDLERFINGENVWEEIQQMMTKIEK